MAGSADPRAAKGLTVLRPINEVISELKDLIAIRTGRDYKKVTVADVARDLGLAPWKLYQLKREGVVPYDILVPYLDGWGIPLEKILRA
jgi:hypothetical protein